MLLPLAIERRVRDLLVSEVPDRVGGSGILPRRRPGYRSSSGQGLVAVPPGTGPVPPASPSPPGEPPLTAQVLGYGFPIWLSAAPNTGSILVAMAGPIPGPFVVQDFYLNPQVNTVSGAPPQCWYRVDFSEYRGTQTFTFEGAARPSGGVVDGVTLFPYAGHVGGTDGDIGATSNGWVRVASNITGTVDSVFGAVSRYIPYEQTYAKFYFQNDQTNQRFASLLLSCQRVLGAGGATWQPPISWPPAPEPPLPPPVVVPPMPVPSVSSPRMAFFWGSSRFR